MITIDLIKKIDAYRAALGCCVKREGRPCPIDHFAPAALVEHAHNESRITFFESLLYDAQTGIACDDACPCTTPLLDLLSLAMEPGSACSVRPDLWEAAAEQLRFTEPMRAEAAE